MDTNTRDVLAIEMEAARKMQMGKYLGIYPLSVAVPNNTSKSAFVTIESDADFLVEKITGHIIAPSDANGVRQIAANTDYPLVGTSAGYAEHGLSVKVIDEGAGRTLTSGYVPLELILTPGYRESFYIPLPFKYYAARNSRIVFDFKNRDTRTGPLGAALYHFVNMAMIGVKYAVAGAMKGG